MRFTQQNIHSILLVYQYVLQYGSGSDYIPFSSLNTIQNNFSYVNLLLSAYELYNSPRLIPNNDWLIKKERVKLRERMKVKESERDRERKWYKEKCSER